MSACVEVLWVAGVPRRVCCREHWWQPGVAIAPDTALIASRFHQIMQRETWTWETRA